MPGVRYVLEGTVRQARKDVLVTSTLVDAATGTRLWTERFARSPSHGFATQIEIAEKIVSAAGRAITQAEQRRAVRILPQDLGAWETYQRGLWHMSRCTAAENLLARSSFQHAIELCPTFAAGYGALAWSYMMAASIFSELTIAEGCALGEPLVRTAIALDEDDPDLRDGSASSSSSTAILKEPWTKPGTSSRWTRIAPGRLE